MRSPLYLFTLLATTSVQSARRKATTAIKYTPATAMQTNYHNILKSTSEFLVTAVGPPGSGKTMFACIAAAEKLKTGSVNKIIITRPTISVGEETLGFLPGSMEQKMAPWTRPIYDVFYEVFSKPEFESMLKTGQIEIAPLAFMRGRTFKQSFVIADEMQNSTPSQMRMMLTRLGVQSQMVITGDVHQSDIRGINGLGDLVHRLKSTPPEKQFHLVELTTNDVQRSDIVRKVMDLYAIETKHVTTDLVIGKQNITESSSSEHSVVVNTPRAYDINNDAAMIPRSFYFNKRTNQ